VIDISKVCTVAPRVGFEKGTSNQAAVMSKQRVNRTDYRFQSGFALNIRMVDAKESHSRNMK